MPRKPRQSRTSSEFPPKVSAFLAAIRTLPHVTRAAEAAGIERQIHYRRLATDPHYEAAFNEAWRLGVAALEEAATIRATEGWEEPVFYKGDVCGSVRRFSDRLLLARLGAELPEKYRDHQVKVSGTVELVERLTAGRARLAKLRATVQSDSPEPADR